MANEALTQVVEDIAGVFERHKVQYALIGGLAVSVRGQLRATKDVLHRAFAGTGFAVRIGKSR